MFFLYPGWFLGHYLSLPGSTESPDQAENGTTEPLVGHQHKSQPDVFFFFLWFSIALGAAQRAPRGARSWTIEQYNRIDVAWISQEYCCPYNPTLH